jgi:hypothetical protein
MINEEIFITEKFGQSNPFRVPEGYFDQLSAQVMSKLPERKQKARIVSLRPFLYAAASIALVLVMGVAYFFQKDNEVQPLANNTTTATTYENSYIDDAADYAMLDNVEIYACLSDNY